MTNEIKNRINVIGANFTNDIYTDYINGNITYVKLLNILNCDDYSLKLFFKQNGIKKRRDVLKESVNNIFFDNIDSELKAYLLGFYLADGCIKNGKIKIQVTKEDEYIVKLFKMYIAEKYKIIYTNEIINKKTGYISKPMASISFPSKKICETLLKYGIGENKTYESNFRIDIISDNLFRHFLRGYFDGDGTVCCVNAKRIYNGKEYKFKNYNWSIISNKKETLESIKKILEDKFEIHSNLLKDGRGHFLIEINRTKDFFKMRDFLYKDSNYFLSRKKDKYFSIEKPKEKPKILKKFNNIFVERFDTLTDAGKNEGITPQGIKVRIKNKINVNGFTWEYE